ncbi:cytochrome P450 20A1-like [Pollicipes pollicipes]|uniref:cytochrome P450 20A1-like n=1 Tax=Pollicipes pollicipes TaxID=41117 RepID=UPI0018852B26|nr:cytochrome P450 20A1-like [Pollicipes pollicipes]XP_037075942.1 cytochrome P450 20A1-like [Pollicipes pollicipes]
MLIALVIFAVVFITFLLFVILYIYPSATRDTTVPGPPPSSSSDGNLTDVEMAGGLGEYLREVHAQYGPLVSFHLGKQLVISLGTYELMEQHSGAAERPELYLEFLRPLLGRESIVWADRAETTRRWRLYQQGFSEECRAVYRQAAREAAGRVSEKLQSLSSEEHVSLQQYTSALALHIVARCCFGHHMDDEHSMLSFAQEYEIVTAEVTSEACGRQLYESQQDHLLEAAAALRDVAAAIVRKHRRENKSTVSLVEWVALSAQGSRAGGDSEAHVSDLLALFMFFCETLSSGLCWTLYYLSQHQTVQDAVVAQLAGEQTDTGLVGRVIREAWRLSSVVPLTARCYSSPSAVQGHTLPARTPIVSALCVANTAAGWARADRFDPARFEGDTPPLELNPLPFLSKHDDIEGASSLYQELVTEVLHVLLTPSQLELLPDQSQEQLMTLVTTPREDVWVSVSPRSADA